MSKHLLLEKYVEAVRLQGGINTALPITTSSTVTSTGTTTAGAVSATTYVKGGSAVLTAGATPSLNPALANVFTLTPGEDETIAAASAPAGQYVTIVVTTTGASSRTLTFGTKFKSTGTLATGTSSGKVFTITFVGDGTNLNEVARTTAM
jgi:hypothetical protein